MFTLIGLERPIMIGTFVNTPAGPGRVVSAAINVELDHPRHGIGRDCRTYPLAQVRLLPSTEAEEAGAGLIGHR